MKDEYGGVIIDQFIGLKSKYLVKCQVAFLLMKIFGGMLLGCFFADENIWLNVNLDAFLLLEISG